MSFITGLGNFARGAVNTYYSNDMDEKWGPQGLYAVQRRVKDAFDEHRASPTYLEGLTPAELDAVKNAKGANGEAFYTVNAENGIAYPNMRNAAWNGADANLTGQFSTGASYVHNNKYYDHLPSEGEKNAAFYDKMSSIMSGHDPDKALGYKDKAIGLRRQMEEDAYTKTKRGREEVEYNKKLNTEAAMKAYMAGNWAELSRIGSHVWGDKYDYAVDDTGTSVTIFDKGTGTVVGTQPMPQQREFVQMLASTDPGMWLKFDDSNYSRDRDAIGDKRLDRKLSLEEELGRAKLQLDREEFDAKRKGLGGYGHAPSTGGGADVKLLIAQANMMQRQAANLRTQAQYAQDPKVAADMMARADMIDNEASALFGGGFEIDPSAFAAQGSASTALPSGAREPSVFSTLPANAQTDLFRIYGKSHNVTHKNAEKFLRDNPPVAAYLRKKHATTTDVGAAEANYFSETNLGH